MAIKRKRCSVCGKLKHINHYSGVCPTCRRKEAKRHLLSTKRRVYVLSDGEYWKIGTTTDISDRIASVQTGNARKIKMLGCIAGDHSLEAAIHRDLIKYRMEGEWFRPEPEVRELLESIGMRIEEYDD